MGGECGKKKDERKMVKDKGNGVKEHINDD
jgi:hypothetical protein